MAKPSLEATRWATDETNNDPPSTGQRDTGWTPGQDGVSDYMNALAKAYYDWFAYLNAGLWEDDLHVTGNLVVDGTIDNSTDGIVKIANALTARTLTPEVLYYGTSVHADAMTADISELALSATSEGLIVLTPDADGWTLHGVDNHAEGRLVLVHNPASSGFYFFVRHASTTCPTAANRIALPNTWTTATQDVLVPPGAWLVLRGGAASWQVVNACGVCVGRSTYVGPGGVANIASAGLYLSGDGGTDPSVSPNHLWTSNNTAGAIVFPFQLRAGSYVKSYEVQVFKGSTSGTISARLHVSANGTPQAKGTGETSGTGSTSYTLGDADTFTPFLIGIRDQAFVRVTLPGTGVDSVNGAMLVAYEPIS